MSMRIDATPWVTHATLVRLRIDSQNPAAALAGGA